MKQNHINDEDDVSMYYPDGDAEHMAQDDHAVFIEAGQNSYEFPVWPLFRRLDHGAGKRA